MTKNKTTFFFLAFLSILTSCSNTVKIKNSKQGHLEQTMTLEQVGKKIFSLDSNTAPKPQYIQVLTDTSSLRKLTFLNAYANSIYIYDYDSEEFLKKIAFEKKGPNAVVRPLGYYFKNRDSIYIFDASSHDLILSNENTTVLERISLINSNDIKKGKWVFKYPQYYPDTSTPFMETERGLFLTGQYMRSVPDSIIEGFKFTSLLDLKSKQVSFSHSYPKELYGNNNNWDEAMLTKPYPVLHPDKDKIIYSFPVSHDLYVAKINSDIYSKVYGGANSAGTIESLKRNKNKVSREKLNAYMMKNDFYGSILYDEFREVYYRFLLKGIRESPARLQWKHKPVAIVIMDKDFGYLGEIDLGIWGKWNWPNSFVTQEGLNIEFMDDNDINEVNMSFKIFVPKKINY